MKTGTRSPAPSRRSKSPLDIGNRVADLLLAPVNGGYGIRDPEAGQVGPFMSGADAVLAAMSALPALACKTSFTGYLL